MTQMKYTLPTCFFPTNVIFVDDSREFLRNFTLQLDNQLYYRMFDSPFAALDLLNAQTQTVSRLSERCISEYLDTNLWPMSNQTFNIDFGAIHSEIYNPERFSEVSVVVADYGMPGMNGLEFCEQIQSNSVKKVLLTGQADEKIAIEAFNDGIIDRFIHKTDPLVTDKINATIKELQVDYFYDMSETITHMVSAHAPSCLRDRKFSDFFHKLCANEQIIEYYLTENSGSFLLATIDGKLHCLIVKTQQDLQLFYELALDNHAPKELLQQLKSGQKIPCFWDTGNGSTEWSDWGSLLVPAKKLEGRQTYYYAYLQNHLPFEIRQDNVISYHQFLDSHKSTLLADITS